ncbi:MAG: DUF1549 domain-containing protein, partial [Anaerolineae bacterium]|nr:DUF1549 domain-containing protein [Anaerolineae bacterium]
MVPWAGDANAVLRCVALLVAVVVATVPPGGAAFAADKGEQVDYNRQIQPILADRCFTCHGPDAAKRQAELRLDVPNEAATAVLSPGKSAESELVRRISSDNPDERMPPPDAKKSTLTAVEVALIRRWIDQGARYQTHWAYVAPSRRPLPPLADSTWPLNGIDAFVAQGHAQHGLKPAAEADRRTLLRRLSFDLIGLPPTPAEIAAFLADPSPDAYEK